MGMFFDSKQERLDKKFLKACYKGDKQKAKHFLERGADINTRAGLSDWYPIDSALFVAIYNRNIEMIHFLISEKADIHATHSNSNESVTPFIYAAQRDDRDIAEIFFQQGADVNAKGTRSGNTALHYAAAYGHYDFVVWLLEKGADPNTLNKEGNKAEYLAQKNEHPGIAVFLRGKSGYIAPAAQEEKGWTLTAPDEIAYREEKTSIGYSLTEIFNFTKRTYTRIDRNIATNAESQTTRFFDEFPDKTVIETAHKELSKRGGKADAAAIHGSSILMKKQPNRPF